MWQDKICGIYCIENTVNHKKYIGQSTNVYYRWSKHKTELRYNRHDNDYLQKSWNKYGEDKFEFKLLEECSIEKLDEREIHYIELYNTLNRDKGYNLKTGGQLGGSIVSDSVREKISKAEKKFYENNEEALQMRREAALKQWSNPKIKDKISGKNNGMYGKHHTDEACKKISEAKKGTPCWKKNLTPVFCVELNRVFSCADEAQKELNINPQIVQVCKGNRKTCGGYHWKFITENNI